MFAAGFLLVFAFLPKVAAAIISLPPEITGAILVFTSSFMITSGIEIIASRALSTRTTFAISIGLLLGLATQVDADYFRALAEPWNGIFGDMLTISLAAAIGLTVLFRIGIRQQDAVAWQTADALPDADRLLDKEARAWKLGNELIGQAKRAVADLVTRLNEAHLLDAPIEISASYDGIDLLVELRYRGRAPNLGKPAPGHERMHEEAAVTAGLKSFAAGPPADRTSVSTQADEVTIKLWFMLEPTPV